MYVLSLSRFALLPPRKASNEKCNPTLAPRGGARRLQDGAAVVDARRRPLGIDLALWGQKPSPPHARGRTALHAWPLQPRPLEAKGLATRSSSCALCVAAVCGERSRRTAPNNRPQEQPPKPDRRTSARARARARRLDTQRRLWLRRRGCGDSEGGTVNAPLQLRRPPAGREVGQGLSHNLARARARACPCCDAPMLQGTGALGDLRNYSLGAPGGVQLEGIALGCRFGGTCTATSSAPKSPQSGRSRLRSGHTMLHSSDADFGRRADLETPERMGFAATIGAGKSKCRPDANPERQCSGHAAND